MEDQQPPTPETSQSEPPAVEEPKELFQPDNPDHEQNPEPKPARGSHWRHLHRFKAWYGSHKKWSVPATVIILLAILAGVPFTRYQAAGLVLKKNFSVQVTDSIANTPVSGANVTVGGISGTTDGSGKVVLKGVKVGKHNVVIAKKYYQGKTVSLLVPILKQKTSPSVTFVATGRQVKIVISNLINSKKLDGVDISVADTQAKTDSSGTAFVVLPAKSSSEKATLKLSGYNNASETVQISNSSVKENDFRMTPAGKVYFLSKLSGTIDVVKTNLDGTDRQTILAGTGNEDQSNTVLLASRDWKYLALLSRRSGDSPSVYLIDTSTDKNSVIDSGEATFTLVGWSNDTFVYQVQRTAVNNWQSGQQVIKSYNASTAKLTTLDQTTASGTDQNDWLGQSFGNIYIIGDQIIYTTNWSSTASQFAAAATKQATLNSVNSDGTNGRAIKSFALDASVQPFEIFVNTQFDSPNDLYIEFNSGSADHYYDYTNGQVKDDTTLTDETFYQSDYPTYLVSPSGQQTFWTDPRDGKNTLLVGDEQGSNGKAIASLSDYSAYGWYTDNYLLVSKNSSELYIMPVTGNSDGTQPIKITDYHKPDATFAGYGGGYGGL